MKTVLVATERDLEHNLLAQALSAQGHQVLRSRDGLDALELARNQVPQVLLINASLPKLDGFAFFRRCLQDEQLRKIPVVLFSTRSNDQKSERFALELGVTRFVGNALRPGALDGVVEAALAAAPAKPLATIDLPARAAHSLAAIGKSAGVMSAAPVAAPLAAVASDRAPLATVTALHVADGLAPVAPLAQPEVSSRVASSDNPPSVNTDRTIRIQALQVAPEVLELQALRVEQERLRNALHKAEQQLAADQSWSELFAVSPAAMWVVSQHEQRMLAVNDAALRLFGYAREEFLQLDSPALLRDPAQDNATHVLAFRTREGRALSLLVNTRELSFNTQSAELWVAHDIGYRVRGERALADEVQRLKTQWAALPAACLIITADARISDASAAVCQLLGMPREHLLGRELQTLVPDVVMQTGLLSMAPGEVQAVTLKCADDSERTVHVQAGQHDFGAGQRLLLLTVVPPPATMTVPTMAALPVSKLPAVLEMLRYAEDADESTLLQYAMAQLAHAFDSPLAMFARVERITQTFEIVAINHSPSNRRATHVANVPLPEPWREFSRAGITATSHEPNEGLLVDGMPEISSYLAGSVAHGRELWLLVIGNRETVYTASERQELLECAEILVTLLGRERQQLRQQTVVRRSAAATESMVQLLERVLDRHDPYSAGSGARMAQLAIRVAAHMGLSAEQQTTLGWAARLHDVGTLALPTSLLLYPGNLSVAEQTLLHTHVDQGVQWLSCVDLGGDVAAIVAQHHERMDGSGYPARLPAEHISNEARILAVVDVLDAMISARAHRAAMDLPLALTLVREAAGTLFDANVVTACEKVFAEHQGQWPV